MDEDEKCLELLKLLSKYDLLLEQLQKNMTEGFQNLGRANYHNKDTLRGRYGSDYWDESYEGQLFVERQEDDTLSIVKQVLEEKREVIIEDEKIDEKPHQETELRKRKQAREKKLQRLRHREPLTMFGGVFSVPQSLRQCQSNFKGAIPLVEELVNCRIAMASILGKLENSESS